LSLADRITEYLKAQSRQTAAFSGHLKLAGREGGEVENAIHLLKTIEVGTSVIKPTKVVRYLETKNK
jgi:hypothetical protein